MTNSIVTATEVNRRLSELLNQVHYQGQSFDIKRGSEIVAKLIPVKRPLHANKINAFLNTLPVLDSEDRQDFKEISEKMRSQPAEFKNSWD